MIQASLSCSNQSYINTMKTATSRHNGDDTRSGNYYKKPVQEVSCIKLWCEFMQLLVKETITLLLSARCKEYEQEKKLVRESMLDVQVSGTSLFHTLHRDEDAPHLCAGQRHGILHFYPLKLPTFWVMHVGAIWSNKGRLGGAVVKVSDLWLRGRGFDSHQDRFREITLSKLFILIVLRPTQPSIPLG